MRKRLQIITCLLGFTAVTLVHANQSSESSAVKRRETARQATIAYYRKQIARNPSDARSYYELSALVQDQREKLVLLRTAIRLNPKFYQARLDLVISLLRSGNAADAVEEFSAYLRSNPPSDRDDAFRMIEFARLLDESGKRVEALEALQGIMNVMRQHSLFEACYVFQSVDAHEYLAFPGFIAELDRVRKYCTDTDHRDNAVRLMSQGDENMAAKELELQISVNPFCQDAYVLLARLYDRRGESNKTLTAIKKYFAVETDTLAKCKMFERLGVTRYERHDRVFVTQLQHECVGN